MPRIKGPIVKAAMALAGKSRRELASETGIAPRTLTNALGANRAPIGEDSIRAICEALNLSVEQVVADDAPEARAS